MDSQPKLVSADNDGSLKAKASFDCSCYSCCFSSRLSNAAGILVPLSQSKHFESRKEFRFNIHFNTFYTEDLLTLQNVHMASHLNTKEVSA